jgi:hypothetical protein
MEIQTFDSSIRCRNGDPGVAWYFCAASAARREDDRFLPLPVWGHCAGYLLSLFGAFPRDSEAGFLSGVRHGIPDGWQLGILFRRSFKLTQRALAVDEALDERAKASAAADSDFHRIDRAPTVGSLLRIPWPRNSLMVGP